MRKSESTSGLAAAAVIAKLSAFALLILLVVGCDRSKPAPAASARPAEQVSHPRYYCDAAGSLVQSENGNSQVLAKELFFVTSADGAGTDYAIQSGEKTVRIFRCAADGSLINTVDATDDEIQSLLHIDHLVVLPNGHLFVDGEINPQVGLGIDIDGATSKHRCFLGSRFAWNATATQVAYLRDPPDAPPGIKSEIWVDDHALRQIPQRSSRSLAWEPDGHTLDVQMEKMPTIKIDTTVAPAIQSNIGEH